MLEPNDGVIKTINVILNGVKSDVVKLNISQISRKMLPLLRNNYNFRIIKILIRINLTFMVLIKRMVLD